MTNTHVCKYFKGTCATIYCQDGIQVFYGTETQNYNFAQLYGHYELQPDNVNDRPYFKMDPFGIWWDAFDSWVIGSDVNKGSENGFGHYRKDAYCPHQLDPWGWELWHGDNGHWLHHAGKDLGISCKYSSNSGSLNQD